MTTAPEKVWVRSAPAMYARTPDGSMVRIPEADALVLDRYRDGSTPEGDDRVVCERYPVMPLVYEPQFFGDPFPLYPLVEENPDDGRYTCYPFPGTIVDGGCGRTIVVHQMPPREPEPVYYVSGEVGEVWQGPISDPGFGR